MKNNNAVKVKLVRKVAAIGDRDYRVSSISGAITIHAHVPAKGPREFRVDDFMTEDTAKLLAKDRHYNVTVTAD